ncbi:MAG TPA: hypothetical protein VFV72_15735 [Candidatus Limnocylindrales bacterium]|nr:hypothetical protein [Candidatus Limnocylindrales bacterium]
MTTARRRSTSLIQRAIIIVLVLGMLGIVLSVGAITTNAFDAGDRFENLVARIERIIWPPPADRPTRPTVTVTPPPIESPTPEPTQLAGASPEPTATPPARTPVDVDIIADHEAVFAHEIDKDWCAPAGVQMTLAALGLGDTSEAFQTEIASRVREWETWEDSHNYKWGPAAMASALEAYGAPGYEIHAFEFRGDALRAAAVALEETKSPAILLAWRGAHTWVMTGYKADADPTVIPDAVIEGAYILDPWYPWISSIWGPSDPPGTFQDLPEMKRNFLPWERPEGAYPERDGKWIVLVPTLPAPDTAVTR